MSIKDTPRGSDENLTASSDSFWEVGNYRRTVKRIDDGAKSCDEFMKLIAERAEIEAKYSNKLKNWAKKWEEAIRLGPEYNTMEAAMKGTINEANCRSNVHTKCRDDLMNDVYEFVKKWKTDNYHKSLFQWKETKEAEDGFSKAQKPWAKFLMKVMRAKKAYHTAAKAKEQAEKAVTDANNDPHFPQEKLRKLEDVADKKRDEMEKAKQKYERRIDEITGEHNDAYAEGMTRQFDRCQEFEEKRLEFMKETLMKYHKCLDISHEQEFQDIFLEMSTTFQLANSFQDLDWWSRNHGVAMPHNWPIFEEYDPNAVPQKPEKLQYVANSNQVPLMGYKPVETDAPRPPSPPPSYSGTYTNDIDENQYSTVNKQYSSGTYTNDNTEDNQYSTVNKQYSSPKPVYNSEPQYNHPNPFGSGNTEDEPPDEWDSDPPPVPMDMDIGVPVRALYDYQKVEEDELTFRAGDILTKLSEVDDQGWCLGRFQGQEGLIPADYVEAV